MHRLGWVECEPDNFPQVQQHLLRQEHKDWALLRKLGSLFFGLLLQLAQPDFNLGRNT